MPDGTSTRRTVLAGMAATALVGCARGPRDPRRVVIGASPTGVPFSYVDPASNQLTGAMVDIAALLCTQLGLVPEFRVVPFAALVPSLTTGRIDLISAAMLRTPAREALMLQFGDLALYDQGRLTERWPVFPASA